MSAGSFQSANFIRIQWLYSLISACPPGQCSSGSSALMFSFVPCRSGHLRPHPLLDAHLHGADVHAGLPGGMRLHLQEGASQKEECDYLGQWRSTCETYKHIYRFITHDRYAPFFLKPNSHCLGDWHHVMFGHVDPQSHHVYRYDLSMVGFSSSATPRSPFTARCAAFYYLLTIAETESSRTSGCFVSNPSVCILLQLLRSGGLQVPDPHAGGGGRWWGLLEASRRT